MYITVQDVKNNVRGANAIAEERIVEYIQTEESFVKTKLNLETLPPDNHILFTIIRDFAAARCVLNLQGPNSSEFELALALRRDAKERLEAAVSTGITPSDRRRGKIEDEIHNPFGDAPFFTFEEYYGHG